LPTANRIGRGSVGRGIADQSWFRAATELHKTWRSEQDIAAGKNLLHQGRFQQALPLFQKAARLREANPEPHYSLGVIFKNQRQCPRP